MQKQIPSPLPYKGEIKLKWGFSYQTRQFLKHNLTFTITSYHKMSSYLQTNVAELTSRAIIRYKAQTFLLVPGREGNI